MADQDYVLHYRADNADMLSKNQQVIQSLTAVDALLTKVKNDVGSLYSGMSRTAGTAARRNQAVANSLNQVTTAAGQAAQAVQGLGSATANVRVSAGQATGAVNGFLGKMLALQAVHAILETTGELFEEIKERAEETAEYVAKLRDDSRELASLMGKRGPDNAVLESEAQAALAAGVTPEKAKDYLEAYLGVANVGEDKQNISHETNLALGTEGLKFARAMQIDERVAAKVTGLVSSYQKVGSAEEGMEQVAEAASGIAQGKGTYTEGFKALLKLAPKMIGMAGGTKTLGETGILQGAVSPVAGTEDQAHYMLIQTMRLMNTTDGDPGSGQKGDFLRSIGIKSDMSFMEKLEKLAPHVAGADALEVLDKAGFRNKAERTSAVAVAKQLGVMKLRLSKIAAPGDGKRAMEDTQKRLDSDVNTQRARAVAAVQVQKMIEGTQTEEATTARLIADTRLRQNNPDHYRGLGNKFMEQISAIRTLRAGGGRNETIDLDTQYGVVETLAREGKRVGVDVKKQFPGVMDDFSEVNRSKAIGQAIQAVKAAGGNPYGNDDIAKQLLTEMKRLRESAERTERQRAANTPPRLPGLGVDAPDGGPGRK